MSVTSDADGFGCLTASRFSPPSVRLKVRSVDRRPAPPSRRFASLGRSGMRRAPFSPPFGSPCALAGDGQVRQGCSALRQLALEGGEVEVFNRGPRPGPPFAIDTKTRTPRIIQFFGLARPTAPPTSPRAPAYSPPPTPMFIPLCELRGAPPGPSSPRTASPVQRVGTNRFSS